MPFFFHVTEMGGVPVNVPSRIRGFPFHAVIIELLFTNLAGAIADK